MPAPREEPIGLQLARTAKAVGRAFDDALVDAGGSRPMWLILVALTRRSWGTQAQLADALDITGATLTHHLDVLEQDGLIVRRRAPENRRTQRVELTREGEQMFRRLRGAAVAHDARLRAGLAASDIDALRSFLEQLSRNVDDPPPPELT